MPLAEEHAGWPFITVISQGGHCHRTEAINIEWRNGVLHRFRWYNYTYSEIGLAEFEGILWICGWHEKDSPEVKAMLVARGLT